MPKRFFMTPAAMAAFVLAGCGTLEPPVPEANPETPAQWPIPASGGESSADVGWREFFRDPRLETLIERALENNRDLRVAALNVQRARSFYRIQRSERLPSVNAQGGLNRAEYDGPFPDVETYSAQIGVASFELDLWGRVRHLSDAALQQYFAVEENRRSVQISLIAEVANTYLALAADRELKRIAEATLGTFQEALELTQRQHELGAASALEVAQSRTLVANARADAALFDGFIAQDINALTLLVGSPIDESLLPKGFDIDASGVNPLPVGLPSEVLLRRPDIMAAEHRLLAANANIGAARAAFFPSITLTGGVGTASNEFSDLFGSSTGFWTFMPQITLPIFQGGRLRANRDVAVAERDIALAQYEFAIQNGFREVADALALTETLARRRAALQDMVKAASDTQELSNVRYRAGQVSYLTLLDSQRTLYSAQQALLQTLLDEQANRINLYRVLGGGWRE